jgi:Icc protein
MVAYLNNLPFEPDFVLHTGDVSYNPDTVAYQKAQAILGDLRYPVYYVRGNHDDAAMMRRYLPNLPHGTGRLDYDFRVGDYHIVVLDTFGNTDTPTQGFIQPSQLGWLAETLNHSTAGSIILALHHLAVETGVPVLDQKMIITNHEALFEVISPHHDRLRGVFYGHIHRATVAHRNGILLSSAPAVWFQLVHWPDDTSVFEGDREALPGFNIVTINHQQIWVTSHTIPKP